LRTFYSGELHGKVADTSCATMNQDFLALFQLPVLDQRLPRSMGCQWNARRMPPIQRGGDNRQVCCRNASVLRVPPVRTDHGEYPVSGAKLIDLEPYGLNEARDFTAHGERKLVLLDLGILALPDFEVDRIDADRKVSDQHFIGGGVRDVDISYVHDFRAAEGVDSYGFHG
jgi:hypothetical protein